VRKKQWDEYRDNQTKHIQETKQQQEESQKHPFHRGEKKTV